MPHASAVVRVTEPCRKVTINQNAQDAANCAKKSLMMFGFHYHHGPKILNFRAQGKRSTKNIFTSKEISSTCNVFWCERVAEWLRRLTRKPKVRTAVGSNPTLDSLGLSVTLARVDQSHVREIW